MMTIRKLASMKGRSRLRKIALLFRQCSVSGCDPHYLASLVALAEETVGEVLDSDYDTAFLTHLIDGTHEGDRLSLALLDAYYLLSAALGETVADWDWEDEEGALDPGRRIILDRYLILDRIRSPYNVGSIFRNADAFAIKKIYLIEGSADPGHSRSVRTSRGTVATVDHEVVTEDRLFEIVRALALPILALESGGVDITTFPFPEAGIAVIGGEEVGVTPSLLRLCDASLGRATIMMGGTKGSLNVASATAIMLQRWYTS